MNLEQINHIWQTVRTALEYPIFSIGDNDVTGLRILLFVVFLVIVRIISKSSGKLLERSLESRGKDRRSVKGVARLVEIIVGIVGLVVVFDLIGLNIGGFLALFAALGVGIGFGLQNFVNNLVSSFIVLFEQPIRPGDFIEIEGEAGEVKHVGLRASRLMTNDGLELVVPNSKFLENSVVNWTLSQPLFRLEIPFGVHYKSDPKQVREVAKNVARQHDAILKTPETSVQFMDFGDSSLDFRLLVWMREPWNRMQVKSEVRYLLFDALTDAGIEIPYPQRDLHLRSSSIELGNSRDVDE